MFSCLALPPQRVEPGLELRRCLVPFFLDGLLELEREQDRRVGGLELGLEARGLAVVFVGDGLGEERAEELGVSELLFFGLDVGLVVVVGSSSGGGRRCESRRRSSRALSGSPFLAAAVVERLPTYRRVRSGSDQSRGTTWARAKQCRRREHLQVFYRKSVESCKKKMRSKGFRGVVRVRF